MATTSDLDKLRVLLPHWMEHNGEHAAEFRDWAERALLADREDAAWHIKIAAERLEQANEALAAALEKLGGPLKGLDEQPR